MKAKKNLRRKNGDPWLFFEQLNILLDQTKQGFSVLAETDPDNSALYEAGRFPIEGVNKQIDGLKKAVQEDGEVAEGLTRVLLETGANPLMASTIDGSAQGAENGAVLANAKTGLDIGKDILGKASEYLPPPWNKASKNIGEVLGIIGKIAGDKSSELKKIEELEQTIAEIQEELTKVEGKAERLGELGGHPVVAGEDKNLVPPPPPEGFPQSQVPGSLLWMIWQNQFKLEHLWRKTYGDDIPSDQQGWISEPPSLDSLNSVADKWLKENGGQVGRLAYKIDKLAELLGKAIVDSSAEWDPEPPIHMRTVNPETHNKLPEKAVKEELHELEDLLKGLRKLILIWLDIDILDIDIDIDIVNVVNKFYTSILEHHPFKRIYVYDEGVFEAKSYLERERIKVRTPAFDLAGWIDLDEMRVGDAVQIDVYVLLPSGTAGRTRRRLYTRKVFRGTGPGSGRARRSPLGRGVKTLQDICGPSILAGKAIDIDIRQIASVSGYPSPVKIAYQFVVQSSNDKP